MLLFFLNYFDLYLLNPVAIAKMFNPIEELVIQVVISSKQEKAATEIYPVIVEAKIRKCSK